jgi:hypothetical protein
MLAGANREKAQNTENRRPDFFPAQSLGRKNQPKLHHFPRYLALVRPAPVAGRYEFVEFGYVSAK